MLASLANISGLISNLFLCLYTFASTVGWTPNTLGSAFKCWFGLVTCCWRATWDVWYSAAGRGLNNRFFFSLQFSGPGGVLNNSSSRSKAAKSSSKCRVILGRICLMMGVWLLLMYWATGETILVRSTLEGSVFFSDSKIRKFDNFEIRQLKLVKPFQTFWKLSWKTYLALVLCRLVKLQIRNEDRELLRYFLLDANVETSVFGDSFVVLRQWWIDDNLES